MMRVHVCSVGRMVKTAESVLIEDYLGRFNWTGRKLGLGPCLSHEVDDRRGGGPDAEAALLERSIPAGAVLCCMDERGVLLSSPEFAQKLSGWRDSGVGDVAFVIGGADGIARSLRAKADFMISFGPMVWPHRLARVMLYEQLYRATTILAKLPYHRASCAG